MSDNVIIFGAGASFDAGIPLLSGFVERMWEIAIRGKWNGTRLSDNDQNIFRKAMDVKDELDSYHGRSSFDDRNIEDILSILSFNILGDKKSDKDKLGVIIKAITRTIELSCNVKHDGNLKIPHIQDDGPDIYRTFWFNYFELAKKSLNPPTIITFNYDLVLERALFQLLINRTYTGKNNFPFEGIRIRFYYDHIQEALLSVERAYYWTDTDRGQSLEFPGTTLTSNFCNNPLKIEILKLHGSLNFPRKKPKEDHWPITIPVDDPYILPPISNKLSTNVSREMWGVALNRLRKAKNVIIVGYSLPKTDIYMQYFIKTALGPNRDLNKIYVFDPVLYKDGPLSNDMKNRYACCFSPQLQSRIVYKPNNDLGSSAAYSPGTFEFFVRNMDKGIFF